MKDIITVAYYEILRFMRHRVLFLLLFAMPLLIIFILGSALSTFFTSKPVHPGTIRLALLMGDDGFIRPSLERLTNGGALGDAEVLPVQSEEDLHMALRRGEADAGLAVPAGFSESLRQGRQPEWEFVSGGNTLKAVFALQVFHAFFDGWNQRFAESGGWTDGAVPLDVPALPRTDSSKIDSGVTLTLWNGSEVTYSALQYYSAHMLVMFMLYFGMAAAINLVTAKENHTLYRMRTLPVPTWRILTGNVAGQSAVALLQTAVIIGGTAWFYGVDWGGRFWLLALVCLLVMLFTQSLAVMVGIASRRSQEATILFQSITIVMTFLAGGFTPNIGESLSRLGVYTINYWAAQSMLRMMLHADTSVIMENIAVLGWWSAGALAAAAAVYWKAGYHE